MFTQIFEEMLALPYVFKVMPQGCWGMMQYCTVSFYRNVDVLMSTCIQLFIFPHKIRIIIVLVCVELST